MSKGYLPEEYNRDPRALLTSELVSAIKEFVDYRGKHGGILLPDVVMVENSFDEAMKQVGLRERQKPIQIIGRVEKYKE